MVDLTAILEVLATTRLKFKKLTTADLHSTYREARLRRPPPARPPWLRVAVRPHRAALTAGCIAAVVEQAAGAEVAEAIAILSPELKRAHPQTTALSSSRRLTACSYNPCLLIIRIRHLYKLTCTYRA